MDQPTSAYYCEHACEVAARYESVEGGISTLFPWVFTRGRRVLDVGAGSGRDLARLQDLGMEAWGLEPAEPFREEALRLHPGLAGRLAAGGLPGTLPAGFPAEFDGIVCSAVLMHVPEAELFDAAWCLRGWLREGGRLLLSVATASRTGCTGTRSAG